MAAFSHIYDDMSCVISCERKLQDLNVITSYDGSIELEAGLRPFVGCFWNANVKELYFLFFNYKAAPMYIIR